MAIVKRSNKYYIIPLKRAIRSILLGKLVFLSCGGEQPNPHGPERAERPLRQNQVDPRQVRWMMMMVVWC